MKLLLTQSRLLNFFNLSIIFFLIFMAIGPGARANEKIIVLNNKRISSETIKSLAPKNFDINDPAQVNDYQKKLFETGFFENVFIKLNNNNINISVLEYPLVNFFNIEGVKNSQTLDQIYKIVKLKENDFFRPFLIKNDIQNVTKYLNRLGYLNPEFSYQIIDIKDGKINLFYKINLNQKFKINRIFFIGDKYFESSKLIDVVFSAEDGWWKFFANNNIPSEEIINIDISKIKNFYLDNGFYDVQVNSSSIKILNDNKVDITYSINAGKKYLIDEIKLTDNSKILNKEDFNFLNKKLFKIKKNYYSRSEITNLFNYINNYFLNANYNIKLNYTVEKNNDKLFVTFFSNDKIKKQIINKIIISGNSLTEDKTIRASIKFFEGDILNSTKVSESVETLKGKGLFKNVTFDVKENENNNNVDVEIKVEEQPTGEIAAGAGGGTNGFAISGTLKEKNFLGKGVLIDTGVNIGTQKMLGNIYVSHPDFLDTGNKFDFSIFVTENYYDNASYENKQIGVSTGITYEVFDKFFFNPGFGIDFDSVTANSDASTSVKRNEGDFFTSKVYYNATKNTKNRDFQPTSGYVIGFGQSLSFFSDIPYLNNKIYGSYYDEYKDKFIGSLRYKIENINGFDKDIKFSDRLFVGSNNLRGFSNRGIGPKIDNDFIGGNYSYYGTISSTFPNGLPDKWNAKTNIFFDTANVWGVDDKSIEDSNKLRSSTGLGLSWISPLGPLSFTYAIPISKESTDDVENFSFTIGSAF